MNVPLLDLKAQYQSIKDEIIPEVLRVMESQYFILGPDVDEFEKKCAEYLQVKHALGVSSGTDALLLALMALGIGPGDSVIVPTFSFFATAGVISRLHAEPVFVDCDPVTFNIDPVQIRKAIEQQIQRKKSVPKAVIPVHLFGQSAEMDEIGKIAREYDLSIVEDAAQAIGTQYKSPASSGVRRKVGGIGHIGCFSFFPSKNLGGFGDAGLITTNDDALYHKLKIMRVHGGEPKYYHKIIGGNFRLDALQAVVLNVKLRHLEKWSQKRIENAKHYNRLFIEAGLATCVGQTRLSNTELVLLPKSVYEQSEIHSEAADKNFLHIYNQYCIRTHDRDGLIRQLRNNNIGCEIYYPVPFHKQECFKDVPSSKNPFPVSDFCADTIMALPVYPELTPEMQQHVVETIAGFFNK